MRHGRVPPKKRFLILNGSNFTGRPPRPNRKFEVVKLPHGANAEPMMLLTFHAQSYKPIIADVRRFSHLNSVKTSEKPHLTSTPEGVRLAAGYLRSRVLGLIIQDSKVVVFPHLRAIMDWRGIFPTLWQRRPNRTLSRAASTRQQ